MHECQKTLWSNHLTKQVRNLSNAIFVATLAIDPFQTVINDKEFVETRGVVNGSNVEVIFRAPATKEGPSTHLKKKKRDDLILLSGELQLAEKNTPDVGTATVVVYSCSDATKEQFINEVTIVGRFCKDYKEAEKSCARNVVCNRYRRVQGQEKPEQISDFFRIRGFGAWKERIMKSSKGALVELNGVLTEEKDKAGKPYPVVKLRKLRTFQKGSGGQADPAQEKAASGYEPSQFLGLDDDNMPTSNW